MNCCVVNRCWRRGWDSNPHAIGRATATRVATGADARFSVDLAMGWLGEQESNPHRQGQNLGSCRWTIPQVGLEGADGLEPSKS